ncbi:bifunctional hydroxymethylpyrimidine kinase/phosphomethylpyrimidine kinase [Periweissella fabalis]|uniref:Hydroxymethylpyrimidine/phosphomethylpyrimidine kinase n=1 Tax=Periweissella fabalis TaxID=1070421 RepID=A0A7X6N4B6_9LACO|nr:bifunctional hydroxymethylpyrimidine kinase/phosphomethylpyrimidine kinase [Periweissella fabalis]MCM0599356.1 bifunctional hydroxymethylpyrimidine kinase/phosphomethylpyrimidine kinase [Periweissella fabalis]NKZ23635.1 bifunctional hydroxymethylpyrimidine kinase/phosphomethylpyrimidine kinase [Periweissella fabalis]
MSSNVQQFPQMLTVAGIDSSGGAGINADVATAFAHHVYPATVVVAVTAQNTYGVQGVQLLEPQIIEQQFASIADDLAIRAVKTGMLGDQQHVEIVAKALANYDFGPIIIDPVMVAKGGAKLLSNEAVTAVKTKLLPLATLVTPNLLEAQQLTGIEINTPDNLVTAAHILQSLGAKNVLIKGGHAIGNELTDYILLANQTEFTLVNSRVDTIRTHGTGDTYAAAIASNLALGYDLVSSIKQAKEYLYTTITNQIIVGHGHGPLNHWGRMCN